MKLCRYDDDRLGVVLGDKVHDVTAAQTEIRASTPYTAKVDPVVAALPAWRERLEKMAASAPGRPLSEVKLLSPVARPPKIIAAPTNYAKHVEEMQKFRDTIPGLVALFARHREGRHLSQIQHLAGRAVGRRPDALSRPAQRPRGRAGR
jgi:2-keto-4-pentenoate hydratase/2-oxohepta-3-ene-1,7-dioic acid hydratase in catechol pathway